MTMTDSVKGYILGAVAAVSYGTNPLFAVPLYDMGLSTGSVLFYRYAFAVLILGLVMLKRGDSFRLSGRNLWLMVAEGVFFALSSVLLFEAYRYMDVGLASTLLFVEPVFIALMLWLFFKQRISGVTVAAIALCLAGVVFLANPGEGAVVTTRGLIYVILSALCYAVYMVLINKTSLQRLKGTTITFYSLLFGILVFVVKLNGLVDLQPIPGSALGLSCIVGISVLPTIVSLLTVAVAIGFIGSVAVAILGALEPITGVLFGVMLFDEVLTVKAVTGMVLIIGSVIVLIAAPRLKQVMRRR